MKAPADIARELVAFMEAKGFVTFDDERDARAALNDVTAAIVAARAEAARDMRERAATKAANRRAQAAAQDGPGAWTTETARQIEAAIRALPADPKPEGEG